MSVRLRVRDLVTHLQKMSFPIERRNSRIYWNFGKKKIEIIISKDLDYKGVQLIMAKKYVTFSRNELARELDLTIRTANTLIRNWTSKKLIEKDPLTLGYYFWLL